MQSDKPPTDSDAASPVTLLGMAAFVARHLRTLVVVPAAVVVLALATVVLGPAEYAAESTILPLTGSGGGTGLASVASRFGLALGGGSGPGESVDFYAQLLTSRDLLREAVRSRFAYPVAAGSADSVRGTLVELFRAEGETPEEKERAAIAMLFERIAVEVDLRAGTIKLRTRASHRRLAEQVNRRLLGLVNTYNVERRRSQARAEREFAEQRVREARDSVLAAEGSMESFLARNRSFRESPRLTFEAQRLERRIALHQALYTALAQARDQARLAEVRDTPVLTVVAAPESTARNTRQLLLMLVVATFLGGMLAVMSAFVLDVVNRERRELPEQAAQLRTEVARLGLRWARFRHRTGWTGGSNRAEPR